MILVRVLFIFVIVPSHYHMLNIKKENTNENRNHIIASVHGQQFENELNRFNSSNEKTIFLHDRRFDKFIIIIKIQSTTISQIRLVE